MPRKKSKSRRVLSRRPVTTTVSISRDTAPANEQRRTSFLDLSPELRNKIYEHVLPRNGLLVTPFDSLSAYDNSHQYDHHEEPSLLRASLQIQAEASPIFYGRNTLRVSYSQLYNVANFLGPKKLSMLRCFQITDHVIDLVREEQWPKVVLFFAKHIGVNVYLEAVQVNLAGRQRDFDLFGAVWLDMVDFEKFLIKGGLGKTYPFKSKQKRCGKGDKWEALRME